ncbi:MAG: hypothetical protein KC503_35820 [Myxococcales bacterium]|nr:hypothetical protein [Myxococcales bacterium]
MRQLTFVAVLIALSGCGSGELSLKLVPAGFDDPFSNLARIIVTAQDVSFQTVATFNADNAAGDVDLGELAAGDSRLVIAGVDAADQVLSRGTTRQLALGSSTSGEELVPFSSLRVASALPTTRALSGTPAIDGLLDEWKASPSIVLDAQSRVSGPETTAADVRAEVFFAWAANELRFAIAVLDDCITLKAGESINSCAAAAAPDRVTIGFDGADDGGTFGSGDFFLELTAGGATRLAGNIDPSQFQISFGVLAGRRGWAVEGLISLGALGRGALQASDRIGFDVSIIDEDPEQPEPTVLRFSTLPGGAATVTPVDSMSTLGFGQP